MLKVVVSCSKMYYFLNGWLLGTSLEHIEKSAKLVSEVLLSDYVELDT